MRRTVGWCIAHRRRVFVAWVAVAVLTTVLATVVGRHYSTNFTLRGTESQQARDLLTRQFPSESGDIDTIVYRVSTGSVDDSRVRAAITRLLSEVRADSHVNGIVSPYSPRGAAQISPDRRTAFAVVDYDNPANLLPTAAGKPVLTQVARIRVPGLTVAAGGQVMESAEGFRIGPATEIGAVAALLILLLTFGSLLAAGLPLLTAGLGLLTAVALIGLATRVTSMANVAPQLALMIGLGVGIDYALFIVTRFRESFLSTGDVHRAVVEAMDTSGRAVVLAGTTVVIALLGMFATGVSYMYGLAIASALAVLLTMAASLTLLPAVLSRVGHRVVRTRGRRGRSRRRAPASTPDAIAPHAIGPRSRWRRWSLVVQSKPWPLAIASLAVMIGLALPALGLRLATSDAGNDPAHTSTRNAFDLLARGFGGGFNGPLVLVAALSGPGDQAAVPAIRVAVAHTPDIAAVSAPRVAPAGRAVVIDAYPDSASQAAATTRLVNHLRQDVLPPIERRTGVRVLVGGFTAASIDFAHALSSTLPLFIAIVIVLSALLLLVLFRSVVIPVQAALMNLLSIGAALGVTVAVFQDGWCARLMGVQRGPVEPWIPVLMFAVVFGLSMDYEVFLVSRVREQWIKRHDASSAVADGIASTGRVISAAAAIMVCVFLSFMFGDQRTLKEFGFGLAVAVLLDALIVRCVLLPAVLELLGKFTWWLPRRLDTALPDLDIGA
jgi:RND superfamily putative drug exporter